ncbi:MAG: GtrA family protein [Clostridia bacterium]|nr:GtrA family protein [Clostridia bacterium]
MIDCLRKIAFKIVKPESFLGKLADKILTREIFMYLVFGVATTVVNLGVFYLCNRAFEAAGWQGVLGNFFVRKGWVKAAELFSTKGSEYLDSTFIAWVAGVLFAFFTNKLFVFESKSWAPSVAVKEFAGFVGARTFSLFIELLCMFLLVTILNLNELLSKIIVGVVVVVLNYIFSKLLVFRNSKEQPEANEEQ